MADEADLAQAIRATTRQPKLQGTGFCHNCEAPVPRGWLFCDALCREDYDRIEAARARSGNIEPS